MPESKLKLLKLGHIAVGDAPTLERSIRVFLNGNDVSSLDIVEADDDAGYLRCYLRRGGAQDFVMTPDGQDLATIVHSGRVEFYVDMDHLDVRDAAVMNQLPAKARQQLVPNKPEILLTARKRVVTRSTDAMRRRRVTRPID